MVNVFNLEESKLKHRLFRISSLQQQKKINKKKKFKV